MASPLAQMLAQVSASGTPTTPFRATVQPTDVQKAYSDYNNAMMQAYSAQVGQQNAMWGGLAGLGSAGLLGSGGVKGLSGILSGAGGAAGSEGSTAIADSLGLGSGISDADLLASLALV
jgi:hypothetical protein